MIERAKEKRARDAPAPAGKTAEADIPLESGPEPVVVGTTAEAAARARPVATAAFEQAKKTVVEKYGEVTVYRVAGEPMLYYQVPVPRPTAAEKAVINTIKEAATRLISVSPYRIRDAEERRNVYYQKVMEILRASPELKIPEHRYGFYAEAVVREMVGYGIIDSLVRDDRLEEIMVIGPQKPVYVYHRDHEMMLTNIEFYNDNEVQDLISKIARQVGRRVDISSPLLDARLPDGSRVNATIPPASVDGSTLTIRKFREDPYSIVDLIRLGTVDAGLAAFFWLCVEGLGVKPANILIAGGTGSGKTTTLNVLASFIPARERIVSIEDTAELALPLMHWVRLEARPPGLEGTGELALDILTKNALRMRPDRIIVGEVRHEEAFSLFTAMNTGHRGSMGTVHANSPKEAIVRITSPPMSVPEVMLSGLDFVVIEHRIHDKKKGTIRRVTEVAEVLGVLEGRTTTQTVFEWDAASDSFRRTPTPISFLRELEKFSAFNRKQLDAELADRATFLASLARQGVRGIAEVSKRCQDFLLTRRQRE
ncbi:MAG: CpaF family protein [Candidatus Diapherotrites archaeon]|uniref:CpaF family protein n=1 Tax=Candidatus Iainarchaeum sp. TaxID=3101447 RepID=A0A8T4LHY7_9ARCH|nr:CpaF family protein [Candidatus Diapherotrites archaeon]